ncbi:hypothetical protein PoB_003724100 [Plakobranchus ocellatus]|uniref:Uncharacterized protein n=1 Tax=Plakobranchus ocellatus TaxID=259542 RepID=A0AAV4AHT6_9GAST|nr:hypothetical protein PoB_003724100 [Plakobranchus ocellatus]
MSSWTQRPPSSLIQSPVLDRVKATSWTFAHACRLCNRPLAAHVQLDTATPKLADSKSSVGQSKRSGQAFPCSVVDGWSGAGNDYEL